MQVDVRDLGSIPGSGRSPEMATHSGILAWRILWTEEPGRLHRVGHNCSDLACTQQENTTYHNKLWKILQEMGTPDHLTCLLRNLYAGQEEELELDTEEQTGSKLGKEDIKDIYIVTLLI